MNKISIFMKNFNKYQLAAIGLIIIGIIIRLININQPLLEFFPPRQTQTAEITRNIYINGWPDFWTPKVRYLTGSPVQFVVEFPLYNGIVALAYRLLGPNIILGRLVSLAFFILSSITFYKILVSRSSPASHQSLIILSLIFYVFSPLHILTSRSFQPEEIAFFLLLLAIQKSSWVFFSLAVLTKLPTILFAPVLFYQLYRGGTAFRRIIIGFSASLMAPIEWFLRAKALADHPELIRNAQISNWFQPQLWLQPGWYFSLFQIEHIWVLTTLGLLFFWLGLFKIIASLRGVPIKSGRRGNPVFWIIWLTSGLLYLAIFNYHAMTHEYYHLFLLPPLSIFVGLGLNQILEITRGFSKNIRTLSVAGILILFFLGLVQPAIKKIISVPKSPEESQEITTDRYRLIEDF